MLSKTILLTVAAALPGCLASLSLDAGAPVSADSLLARTHGANASYLETMSDKQRQVFEYVMDALDENYSPPFLVSTRSSSSPNRFPDFSIPVQLAEILRVVCCRIACAEREGRREYCVHNA
jgi:hypothetical protein